MGHHAQRAWPQRTAGLTIRCWSLWVPLLCIGIAGCNNDDALITLPDFTVEYELIGADRDGELYLVDPSDGSTTLWLDTFVAGGANVEVVSASLAVFEESDVDPTAGTMIGSLLVGTGGVASCDGCIYSVNPDTGEATQGSSTTLDPDPFDQIAGMALGPDGTIYLNYASAGELWEMEPDTLEVSQVGSNGLGQGLGMTFDAEGTTLYVIDNNQLYVVDPADATPTLVGTFSYVGFSPSGGERGNSMTVHPETGQILALIHDSSFTTTSLVEIDPALPEATLIGDTMYQLDGLAYVPFDVTGEEE